MHLLESCDQLGLLATLAHENVCFVWMMHFWHSLHPEMCQAQTARRAAVCTDHTCELFLWFQPSSARVEAGLVLLISINGERSCESNVRSRMRTMFSELFDVRVNQIKQHLGSQPREMSPVDHLCEHTIVHSTTLQRHLQLPSRHQ